MLTSVTSKQTFYGCNCGNCSRSRSILMSGGLSEGGADSYLRGTAPQNPIPKKRFGGKYEIVSHEDLAASILRAVTNGAKEIIENLRKAGLKQLKKYIS